MKKVSIILGALCLVIAAAAVACNSGAGASSSNEGISEEKAINETSGKEARIQRGQYLVSLMGCHDCHSPKVMTLHGPQIDSTRLLSGHPASLPLPKINVGELKSWVLFGQDLTTAVGPWGVSFSANLTSDETGIGNWSEEQFIKSIREGKYKGMDNTRPLLPPMPWDMIRRATDEDLKAIFAYLKSTRPVENRVPAPIPPDQLSKL